MSVRLFNDAQQWELDDGLPNAGGKITFYEAGTTTLKSVYTTSGLTVAHANPVILDANGRPTSPIWLNGEYKYKVTTSADVDVGLTIDNVNIETIASTANTGLLVLNGSFEIDEGTDGSPDNWTLSALSSATIATDTTDSAHGVNSLKFTSGADAAGGGTATSERFDVLKSEDIIVKWTHKSSSATALTKVDIKTYDKDNVVISTLSVYSEGAANPTSYTTFQRVVTADATAVTAEIVLTGVDSTSTTKINGTTNHFDNVYVTLGSKVVASEIVDDNGNEAIKIVTTASAVNEITITPSATGNAVGLSPTGDDTNIDLDLTGKGTGEPTNQGSKIQRTQFVTAVAIGSVTTKNYTGVPSWAKKITIGFAGLSTDTAGDDFIVQIGDSGGIETTGYLSKAGATPATIGFAFAENIADTNVVAGNIVLYLHDSSTNQWTSTGLSYSTPAESVDESVGVKALSAVMTQFQVTTVAGTGTFDAGTISILYEG